MSLRRRRKHSILSAMKGQLWLTKIFRPWHAYIVLMQAGGNLYCCGKKIKICHSPEYLSRALCCTTIIRDTSWAWRSWSPRDRHVLFHFPTSKARNIPPLNRDKSLITEPLFLIDKQIERMILRGAFLQHQRTAMNGLDKCTKDLTPGHFSQRAIAKTAPTINDDTTRLHSCFVLCLLSRESGTQ